MKYLSTDKNNYPSFKDDLINEILDTDVVIEDSIYEQFFDNQALGKQYRVKNIKGKNFDDIFEEYIPEPSNIEIPKTQQELEFEELKKEQALIQKALDELILNQSL